MKVRILPVLLLGALWFASACNQPAKQQEAPQESDALAAFMEQVEPIIVVKMHLFPLANVAEASEYPYSGTPVTEAQAALLDDALKAHLENEGLWVCYKVQDDLLIFRTGGGDTHSKLVLARANHDTGKIEQLDVVAWYTCDEQGCDHQEAWLADLDLDNHLELVLRHQKKDASGNLIADEYTVLTQKGDGNFQPGLDSLLVKENYKMSM
ncbi:MAG: hypothetical protein D6818_09375 [Bacteroidetes bacterium]|nr:MAG: hypothetical protein D6818_09375 [Bacteroidota bacterium]